MKIKVYCTNIFVFWISMLCVHFDGCAAGWCYKCLLPLFSLWAAPGGGEGEKTLLACSWQRAALDCLLSSSLQKPFLRLLRCLYFRKSFGCSGQDLCACGTVFCVGKRAREAQGRARADTCCLQPSCGAGGHSWGWLGQFRPSSRPLAWGAPALGVGVLQWVRSWGLHRVVKGPWAAVGPGMACSQLKAVNKTSKCAFPRWQKRRVFP